MNFSPFFYSDHRHSGGDAAAGAAAGERGGQSLELYQQPQTDSVVRTSIRRFVRGVFSRFVVTGKLELQRSAVE